MMSKIELKNISKTYKLTKALDDLSIQVTAGEVYGFIGQNGAGKTTTINIILSMIHKDSGQVLIDDEEIFFANQAYKNKIGFVPDVPVFPTYMNAREYLTYTLDIYGIKDNQNQRITDTLKFVSLPDTKKRITSYSRGMKQRLAIAQALVHDPDILIMDEPTSALDPIGRNDVMNMILELKGKKTVFYSTHILDDVEKVCDRIGMLHKGRLVLEDSISNLQDRFYARRMFVETKSEPQDLIAKLTKTEMISKHKIFQKGLMIMLNDDVDSNDFVQSVIELGEEIIEYRQVKPSIEDIFIEEINHATT
jgi:ABC-2 type transport system ATP-binding protein